MLYVKDVETCARFWVEQVGMVERKRMNAGPFLVLEMGFTDQPFSLQLVPLEMMRDNPDALDLATPSMAFRADDLDATRATLMGRGVQVTEISESRGPRSFAMSDPEGHWFAVTG